MRRGPRAGSVVRDPASHSGPLSSAEADGTRLNGGMAEIMKKTDSKYHSKSHPLTGAGRGMGVQTPPGALGDMPHTDAKVGALKQMIDSMPDVRQKKIQNIKRAIKDGKYKVEKEKLAKKVVKEAATDAIHRGKVGLERWPRGD